jgi:hypothetical protein
MGIVAIAVRHFAQSFTAQKGVAGTVPGKCYIVTLLTLPVLAGAFMTHHHHGGEPHPPPTITPSLLRLSAPRRLAIVGVSIALIWLTFLWATH